MGAPTTRGKRRLFAGLMVIVLVFLLLTLNLFSIQVIRGDELQQKALAQWTRNTTISAERGDILDSSGTVLATSSTAYKVLVWPQQILSTERERIATELSNLLELDYKKTLEKVSNSKMSEIVLKRQVDRETIDKINELQLGSGVVSAIDTKRYYPLGKLYSQLLGFTTIDGAGQSGLELKYNKYLTGKDGSMLTEQDMRGQTLAYGTQEIINSVDGCDIVLTSDSVIQSYLESAMQEALEVNEAKSVQGIIMEADTGAIAAMASVPDYDANEPPRSDIKLLSELSRNKVVADAYEPGSTFKILTLSSAIDSGAVDSGYTCFCGGSTVLNGETIKCWKSGGHGSQTLTECAENSCNVAFMNMALRMGVEKFYDYIYAFGLGSATGSGITGEATGIVTHEKYIRENDLARIGFGQSIAVTPIQLANAVCAAVNGGNLMKPYIVDRILNANGDVVTQNEPVVVRRVISEETSVQVRQILESVVKNGSGKNASVNGYRIGGKTGTAQKYQDGKIASGKLIASFIGFAPADDPKYVCLILVDEPQVGTIFGSTVAAPFVGDVLGNVLKYKGFPSSSEKDTVELPDLSGKSVRDAKDALSKLGLNAVYQNTDKVTAQVPKAGTSVVKGSDVLLYTEDTAAVESTGDTVTMVNISGKTRLEAYDILKSLGLSMKIDGEYNGGTVNYQSVEYGRSAKVGDTVTVRFTK